MAVGSLCHVSKLEEDVPRPRGLLKKAITPGLVANMGERIQTPTDELLDSEIRCCRPWGRGLSEWVGSQPDFDRDAEASD